MKSALHIQMLGGLRVVSGNAIVTKLYAAPIQSLFAWLVLHAGVPQPRAHLAFLFWPDSTEAQARTNLRKAIHHLQHALPDAGRFLACDSSTITWRSDAPYTLDVAEFEAALHNTETAVGIARAVALYRGDLLPHCYDDWIVPERERLRQAFTRLLETGIAQSEAAHDYPTAIRYAQRLVEHDPVYEAGYHYLMQLHALNADRAEALRVYRSCATILERELGVEPSPTLQELYARLRTGQGITPEPLTKAASARAWHQQPNNLPTSLTPFIGREREVAAITERLRRADVRLLTLSGAGGTGKTRLGLHVAGALLDQFKDGVFFVDLVPLRDPALVPSTIARTLDIREAGSQPLVDSLKQYLSDKQMLLVLDNFEQVLEAGPFVTELLAAAPRLKVLVTSREVLQLYGEHELEVPPLMLPDLQRLPSYESLMHNEAVYLFTHHAQATNSLFVLTEQNAPIVAGICTRLEGLPLAIELAAARSKSLSPQAMLEHLSGAAGQPSFQLLTGSWRDKPVRHRTLRSTIDWSYCLLDANEQRLFARLAIFVGGCTVAAAEAVCGGHSDLLPGIPALLASLVDKSLLQRVEQADDEPRYRMLETIREYALEQLAASGEVELLQQRHAQYYLALAEVAELQGPEQARWFDRLEQEHDNLRTVLKWALEVGEAPLGLRVSAALVRFWQTRGYFSEGRQWLEALLAIDDTLPTSIRAKGLNDMGWLAICQADYATAAPLIEASLALWRKLDDKSGIALTLNNLGSIAMYQGEFDRAQTLFEESLALRREVGDTLGIASSLNNLSR